MERNLDIIIFGASGFCGKYTIIQAVETLKDLKWGIAGRNRDKLKQTLDEVRAKCSVDLSNIPIIIADVKNQHSLNDMAAQCKVVANTCGPYRFFGEQVVQACLKSGAHYVDISGEPKFIETMQFKYNKEAEEKGIYIISACGLDSIPSDMGTVFVEKNFNGVVNSIETYIESFYTGENKNAGGLINFGTYESLVEDLWYEWELRNIRAEMYETVLPKFLPKLKSRCIVHKSPDNKYSLPFLGADRSVVQRTQRKLYDLNQKRPIQIQTYMSFRKLTSVLLIMFGGTIMALMTLCSCGKNLLMKYPKFFSFGYVNKEGPTEEQMRNTKFKVTLFARGWSEKLSDPTELYSTPPTKTLKATVSGSNPVYGGTCAGLILSAETIIKELNKLPGNGGVLTTGAAFYDTDLIDKLNTHKDGYKFQLLTD